MENNEITKTNKIKVIVITLLIFIVSIAGISYAYFTIQITGNDTASSMRLTTANLSLVYTDVQIVSGEYAQPGWTQTKTLTVYNDGNQTAYYTIIWRDLYNEVTNNELVISATCSSTSGTCEAISETVVPTETTLAHNINVKKNIEIPVGVTHTYTLTALFKEIGSNQNYNQDKEFYGTLNIAEGKEPVSITRAGTDATTGLPVVRIGTTEEFYDITNAINYSSLDSTFLTKIDYDSSKSILLAKYNLYVGQNCTSSSSCTPIDPSTTGYGLQSVDAKGYLGNWDNPAVGVVPFSGSSTLNGYWYDTTTSTIKTQYGSSYNANNIYDTDYVTAPNYSVAFSSYAVNANYSIAYYVEEYVNRLGVEGTGRLLTYTEANAMTQIQRTNGARFWLGSAYNYDYDSVHNVRSDGNVYYSYFAYVSGNGVRPVIIVSTSDIGA